MPDEDDSNHGLLPFAARAAQAEAGRCVPGESGN